MSPYSEVTTKLTSLIMKRGFTGIALAERHYETQAKLNHEPTGMKVLKSLNLPQDEQEYLRRLGQFGNDHISEIVAKAVLNDGYIGLVNILSELRARAESRHEIENTLYLMALPESPIQFLKCFGL